MFITFLTKLPSKLRYNYHEGTEEDQRYSSTLSLSSPLDVGGGVNAKPLLLYLRERAPVPIVQEAGRAPGPV